MNLNDIRRLFDYTEYANALALDAAENLTEEQRRQDFKISHGSIHGPGHEAIEGGYFAAFSAPTAASSPVANCPLPVASFGSLNLIHTIGSIISIPIGSARNGVCRPNFSHNKLPMYGAGRAITPMLVENSPNAVPRNRCGIAFEISAL